MSNALGNLVLTVILLGLLAAVLVVMNSAAAPEQKILGVPGVEDPDYRDYTESITRDSVRGSVEEIISFGSRFTGSEGEARTRRHIETKLRDAGFRVLRQPVRVTVPVIRHAELLDNEGNPVEGVTVHPLPSNWFRTPTTPPQGLTGRVFQGERGLAREFEGKPVNGNFVMLPLGRPWDTVAAMGASAVLYVEEEDKNPPFDWDHHLRASFSIPRVLLRGDTGDLAGRELTLKVRVDREPVWTYNIIGLLREDIESQDIAIFQSYYDSYSYTSDIAPGARQAVGPATLLTVAERLGQNADALRRPTMVLFAGGHGQTIGGARRFAHVVGRRNQRDKAVQAAVDRQAALNESIKMLETASSVAEDPAYWRATDNAAEDAYWDQHAESARTVFEDEVKRVIEDMLVEVTEAVELARLHWVRAGSPTADPDDPEAEHPLLTELQDQRKLQRQVRGLGSTPLGEAKGGEASSGLIEGFEVRRRLDERLAMRLERQRERLAQADAEVDLVETLRPYERMLMLTLDLTLGGERLGLAPGDGNSTQACQPADSEMMSQFRLAATRLNDADPDSDLDYERTATGQGRLQNLVRGGKATAYSYINNPREPAWYYGAGPMVVAGHTGLAIGNFGDRRLVGTPHDTLETAYEEPEALDKAFDDLTLLTRLVAAMAEQIGRGHARVIPIDLRPTLVTIEGQCVSKIGDSLVANHPMPDALVRFDADPASGNQFAGLPPGVAPSLMETNDENGEFALVGVAPQMMGPPYATKIYMDAAITNPETGEVMWTLNEPDAAADGQYGVKGVAVEQLAEGRATLVMFRGSAVEVFPMPDPNTLRPYSAVSFLNPDTAALPNEYKTESVGNGAMMVCFTPLAENLIFTFKKGAADNPNLLVVAAFALNAPAPDDEGEPTALAFSEAARGYAPDVVPRLINPELDAAWSMALVNNHRVTRQARNGLADRMQQEFTRKGVDIAREALELNEDGRIVDGKLKALESLAYSQLAYPQTRKNTGDAILGIVVFLFLAIPFVVFLEKLLIGSPDIRVQLAWVGLFFLLFFVILRFTHPAYELVRSPLIILIGFVTLALALLVGAFVAAKFSKNVGDFYRRTQQLVVAADVSRAGAAATAFNLGLNNLRRRPIRTGLTVATLILITFVMIVFTSVRSNVVKLDIEMGQARYDGLLIREPGFDNIRNALGPIEELYGRDHLVAARAWGGQFDAPLGEVPELAEFDLVHTREDGVALEATVNGVLGVDANEPRITGIDQTLVVKRDWFEDNDELVCYVPLSVLGQLGLTARQVEAGEANIEINDRPYTVAGAFDPERLDALFGLDGETLMPMNIRSMADEIQRLARSGSADEEVEALDVERLPAESIIITPIDAMPQNARVASIAVAFRGLEYAEKSELVESYLERSGEKAYYGLDGRAYFGGRLRRGSLSGLIDLLLPIIIAALTVLNTMHGSVYERRSELYVFNAVGLSPRHILWLFLAEALVYAVVGVVGGYLFAQGVGAIINNLQILEGLTMNYSSLSGIVVAMVIILVVIASAMFPARMASRLAAPAESMSRGRESSEDGVMELELPFTFNQRDRVAIIPYFMSWFENYGEGSAGEFFCSPPEAGIREGEDGGPEPYVQTQAWLKPYDLGVSQSVELVVHRDEQTGDNVARVIMTRQSGDVDSWERCVYRFIGLLRKRLLTWRGVTDEDRARLLEQARDLLDPRRAEA